MKKAFLSILLILSFLLVGCDLSELGYGPSYYRYSVPIITEGDAIDGQAERLYELAVRWVEEERGYNEWLAEVRDVITRKIPTTDAPVSVDAEQVYFGYRGVGRDRIETMNKISILEGLELECVTVKAVYEEGENEEEEDVFLYLLFGYRYSDGSTRTEIEYISGDNN